MHFSTIVVDDFYEDPHEVRNMALSFTYPKREKQENFPGRNSENRFLIQGLDEMVSSLVQEPVVGSMQDQHGFCRSSLAKDDVSRKYTVHIDGSVHWSGVLYLSAPEHCQGGTEFFRHRETGTDRIPVLPGEAEKLGIDHPWHWGEDIVKRDSNDMEKWELTSQIAMRFNRLILIRSWCWHTAGPSFGDTLENGRLVQLFFFRRADGVGEKNSKDFSG